MRQRGIAVGQRPVPCQHAEKERDEPRLDATAIQRQVHASDRLRGGIAGGRLRGENALHHRAQQRGDEDQRFGEPHLNSCV